MTDSRSRFVVTGAGGYLGPHVVSALADRGHEVLAVVRPGSSAPTDPRATRVEADILASDFDVRTWGEPQGIVHLAWQDGFTHNSPAHLGQLSAHYRLLTAAADAGCPRITALGTMHEVGYWEGAITADTPTNPLSQYGVAKDALRRALPLALPAETSLAWARAYYIYGDDRRSNSIFRKLLEASDAGRTSFPFTSGKNRYDFIRVEELGRQLAALTEAVDVTGTVNCCTGEPISLAEKVEQFIAENRLGISLEYGAFPDRPYDSPGVWGDATVIREVMARG
ncbi:NAD-dependent epimerase/dehydratase family protein [Microbacterium azadirachtae]|uniref:dTDP-6-deoxy-L-talose 4-dehydrogenase (NAD(+)) n=1 Tax=Microbacterium azadirachtae TaxID=582680 RepID=A0A0F0KM58_9MICO|nr:NAD(P)-dependent oxidoreductase [Microbacterium azadirachtae]KJL21534.1 dTDP-6-deoxy-L-talose 4-dehydrogenase (NAD(+)) [Microbacterium azadirachtae]UXW84858.1 NAD(P)-dependent oxidoreductase [Microbacterium azadirachtae]SDM51125.1 dTDP-6-deoxy-L-talose 4-dehydrogenase (NAD+) [Microbacterium azadirachtae]SEG58497.1 dTDP-6-deoxy-L-talose 4-dehydrogenase (NAD+) [Microbacterium azadirachtae]SEG63201.1 dTDP-6-deoxy-L-talose 4-dehydrogenase (NAD+) [Microbacterium azadirachtae]